MSNGQFPCYLVTKDEQGRIAAGLAERPLTELPAGDTLIRVAWSSLNYKDALAATGHPGVVRKFPHVPGIDAAGTIEECASGRYKPGDEVLVTGFGVGADRWGGYAQYIRVNSDWIVPLPPGLSARQCMILGTAGLTAALSVQALVDRGIRPDRGEIVVTGASGGVGCLAVALLAKAGFQAVAMTGKPAAGEFLKGLGAARVAARDEVTDKTTRPLLSARWAGAVDTVGGETLATILRSLDRGGCAAACGLVGGAELHTTVYPFILRGVDLAGIDSDQCPLPRRIELWNRLAGNWNLTGLDTIAQEVRLADVGPAVQRILAGQIMGRVVVRI
jgi:acrylyl-CoA reductase (NADPH)